MNYLPLHIYSGYSYLKSALSMEKLFGMYIKKGYRYAPICDFNSISGFPILTNYAKQYNLIPIYGMETVISSYHVCFFIKNEIGYKNLLRIIYLSSKQSLTGLDISSLSEGLILVLDGFKGKLKESILNKDRNLSIDLVTNFSSFKETYIGIPYLKDNPDYIASLREFASKYTYLSVAFPFIAYSKSNDAISLEILSSIEKGNKLKEKELQGDYYFLEDEILSSYFNEDELFSCKKIAESTSFSFYQKRGKLPHFENDLNLTSSQYLAKLAYEGLAIRIGNITEQYKSRLDYELKTIDEMGYSDYFLIVNDYCKKAKEKGILVGSGRGSSAGSLVSFSLGIVKADPIKYGLLFERFLNPSRASMPDIDMDFEDIRREEVISYLKEKYGNDKVAHIQVIQTLGPKASLHDIGRVYDFEPREIDLIAKTINNSKWSLRENYKKNNQFRNLVDSDNYYLSIVSLASKIEGLPRQEGIHPSGVILNGEPLYNDVPIKDNDGDELITFEGSPLEKQGFLKMDLLGIRYLTTIHNCLDLIKSRRGISINYEDIPYEDINAIKLVRENKTVGIFQLEGKGMNNAISILEPTSFDDIVALIALYRPGPMGFISTYAKRKKGIEKTYYINKEVEEILSPTYGIIVYQEQIMLLAMKMASFSLGEADLFRRAISKKDQLQLKSLQDKFIEGCLKSGYSKEVALKTFEQIYKFASYGFNKSHSVSYAILLLQMAYLKYYYKEEFYSAYLSTLSFSDPKFKSAYLEAKRMGISFLSPDINKATNYFLPLEDNKIMFPLSNLGLASSTSLSRLVVIEREQNGPYKDLFDFACRNKGHGLKLDSFLKYIDAGCFDCFPLNRPSKRLNASSIINYADMMVGEDGTSLLDLDFPYPELKTIRDDKVNDLLYEKEALGVILSSSLLENKKDIIEKEKAINLDDIDNKKEFVTVGIVSLVKAIVTKKGNRMAFLSVYNDTTSVEFTLFPNVYDVAYPILKEGNIILIKGHKDTYKRNNFIADEIRKI